jgi:hypothetical protein
VLKKVACEGVKLLLGDFNAKVGTENIFKLTVSNDSLYHDSTDNGVGLEHYATSKNLVFSSTMFLHLNINKTHLDLSLW